MRFLIVTGLSGSGKTIALRTLEDLGALCVDNLPPTMLIRFMEACNLSLQERPMAAIGVDVRSGAFFDPMAVVKMLREAQNLGYSIDTLFIDAKDAALVNRYKETRRDHPLTPETKSLEEAITRERIMLQPLKEFADHLIDSSEMNTKTLQKMMRKIVNQPDDNAILRIEMISFGFKRGIPRAGDLVFDVSLPAQPLLYQGAWSLDGAGRAGEGFCSQTLCHRGISGQNQGYVSVPAPPLCGRGQASPGDRHRLYGRRAPQRGHYRKPGRLPARAGLAGISHPSRPGY